jgi:RHH-type proline utilization regulon transcriptional repressor/proline dehydrogenase/delta 1-pyrroline-5-carboxylate dehydrogenase
MPKRATGIVQHIEKFKTAKATACSSTRSTWQPTTVAQGTFVPPTLIELNHIGELQREVFGPVLHLVRYARNDLNHVARPDQRHRLRPDTGRTHPHRRNHCPRGEPPAHAGNVYVNRNMVGAVVGVQPFGGEGLSGTGPKAGGPLYAAAPVVALSAGRRARGGAGLRG